MDFELDFTLLAAAAFACIFVIGWRTVPIFERFRVQTRSLGGGLAVAYAFLTLFPELELGHELFGDNVHVMVLVGLIAFLGAERYLERRAEAAGDSGADAVFGLTLGLAWVYVWLLVFTMPEKLEGSLPHALIGILGLGLHLLFKDHGLVELHEHLHVRVGRWVLALAPFAGWATAAWLAPESEAVTDIILALLAGSIFYEVFREELPARDESHYGWFVAGAGVYAALLILAG